ncbi:MAG: type I DNA topoisomerase [Alphaproteobacteria bacterium]|nr:type I DNA topoisomerase [Alphaproteobacteria bacterium]
MKLVIVESPSKAKTIEKYLGSEFEVLASVGHIRDLPTSDKQAIDIENGFVPKYVVSKDKEKVIRDIKKRADIAEEVILATDPDREGEAIAWHLQEVLGLKNPRRAKFHEITQDAVRDAIEKTTSIDTNLRVAQEARRVLDRLFGYTLSKLIWTKVRYGLSAGRVQSPALRIVLEREREIRAFIPDTYWDAYGVFVSSTDEEYMAEISQHITDASLLDALTTHGKKQTWAITSIKETEQQRNPKPPFTTSTLQQAANSRLGYSPSNTMRIAQKLYEKGYITYMRTDSSHLSETAQKGIQTYISKIYSPSMYKKTIYKTKSRNAQEAHEAIRPTDMTYTTRSSSKDEQLLYELIHSRTIASQMIEAKIKRTTITFSCEGIPHTFVIHGSIILEKGWLNADPDATSGDTLVPQFTVGQPFSCKDITIKEKQTSPPAHYTEAGLVKELEARDIGRPSTYASTIRTLVERAYVIKEGKSLVASPLGDVVSTFIEKNFPTYISDVFTAEMEENLDRIASGNAEYIKTIENFYTPFLRSIAEKKDIEKLTTLADAPKEFLCPKCNAHMVIKLSKHGTFMSCSTFPTCTGARTDTGEVMRDPEQIGKDCPRCSKPLVRRSGRFGDFISCSGYPKCKFIETDPEEQKKKDTGVVCTECKKGTLIERRGKFGIFYGCSYYPDCKHAIKAKPTGDACNECGSLMMEGTKTIPIRCSNKKCLYHNPHKIKKD